MLHFADQRLAPRQIIAAGRVAERITGRGLPDLSGTLLFRSNTPEWRSLPASFSARAEGFVAFSLIPGRDMPDLSAFAAVTLRAEYQRARLAPVVAERTITGAELALQEVPRRLGGRTLSALVISGAPFDLSAEVDPLPVALAGVVLRDHDPAEPVAGVEVSAGGAKVLSDAGGRFFLPALPLVALLSLKITEDGEDTIFPFHIDYAKPVNSVTLSLPS
jgi:hypothetical protein